MKNKGTSNYVGPIECMVSVKKDRKNKRKKNSGRFYDPYKVTGPLGTGWTGRK